MAVYSALLLGIALWNGGLGYATWTAIFASNAFRVATFLFMASLLWHAWVGVRDILMDYVKPAGVRLTLEMRGRRRAGRLPRLDDRRCCGEAR